jgi:6-phosphogluconolactonase
MLKQPWLSRRAFVRIMGAASVMRATGLNAATQSSQFAYVGSMKDEIFIFSITEKRWNLKQVIASRSPASLVVHPNRRFLYVVNEVAQHENMPAGSMETFAINSDGMLAPLNRRSLSLSATLPRHLALSPNGKNAIVAVHGGGAYNMLDVSNDGRLGRISGIVKETGCGPHAEHQLSSHPQMVLFDKTCNRVLASDMGSDRLSVLSPNESGLIVQQRFPTEAGSGPRHIVMHPAGRLIYVANELDRSICGYEYDPERGRIIRRIERVHEQVGGCMVFHQCGDFLYTIGGDDDATIQTWRVEAANGKLTRIQKWNHDLGRCLAIKMEPYAVILLSEQGVTSSHIELVNGRLNKPIMVAKIPNPQSIATV